MSTIARPWARLERTPFAAAGWVREALLCAGAMLVTSILVIPVLGLWRADLRVPFSYAGDALLNQSIVKSILDYGWYGTNPRLGAPFGQELYDYPVANGNNLHVLVIAGLGLFSSDPALVTNLFFLLAFPLATMTAYLVLRSLGLSAPVSIGCAVLFALLPYHYLRGEGQLFLGAYYTVPIGVYLVLAVLTDRRLFERRRGGPALGVLTRRNLGTLALCALVGSASLYYAAFTVALVATSGLLLSLARRTIRPFAAAALVAALIGLMLAVNLSPSILYRLEHGRDPAVAARTAGETELLGLKVADLLLPVDGHRFGPFAHLAARYRSTTPIPGEPAGALGLVGTIGFLALLAGFLAAALGATRRPRTLFVALGATLTLSVLIGNTGGFATLFSYLVTPQIRAWNRVGIFVAFVCLAGAGLLLEQLRQRLRLTEAGFGVLVAAVVLVGFVDQASRLARPPYGAVATEYRSDAAFVRSIEQQLPGEAQILQLPYLSFPEADTSRFGGRLPAAMGDYDHLRTYLHSTRLRWSYGAMRGRSADWAFVLQRLSTPGVVLVAAADGFQGLVLDRTGYYDSGRGIEAELTQIVGAPPAASRDGTLSFVNLRGFRPRSRPLSVAQLRAVQWASLFPLRLELGSDFWPADRSPSGVLHWTRHAHARLRLVNPSSRPRSVVVTAMLTSPAATGLPVRVLAPDGATRTLDVTAAGTRLTLHAVLTPGDNVVELDASRIPPLRPPAPDPRYPLYLAVERLTVRESTFETELGGDPRLRPLLRVVSADDFAR